MKIPLDRVELFIKLVKKKHPELESATRLEIIEAVKKEFGIELDEQDVFLLHEPVIKQEDQDLENYYCNVLGIMYN